MDADRQIKFEFFKSQKEPLVLKYHKRLALGLILSPFFLGIFMASLNTPKAPNVPNIQIGDKSHYGYVSLIKAMDEQEAFIDMVQVLDLNQVEDTIKQIQKLGFSVRNIGFKDGGRLYAVGYKNLTGTVSYALLSNSKNEIKISWKNVGTNSILLAEQWDHDSYPIQVIDNGTQRDIELVMTHNDIKEAKHIRELEEKVVKLQQENDKIKKEYSENIIKKTVKENPALKGQEEEIKKYVDLIMSSKK
jgi:hypothetical protein